MSSLVILDLFAEDRAHEEFLRAMIIRIAAEQERNLTVRVRSARGGHPRVLEELALYQTSVLKAPENLSMPDLVCVAIDGNCKRWNRARMDIERTIRTQFRQRAIIAAPILISNVGTWRTQTRSRKLLEAAPGLARENANEVVINRSSRKLSSMQDIRTRLEALNLLKNLLQRWIFIVLVRTKRASSIFLTTLSAT